MALIAIAKWMDLPVVDDAAISIAYGLTFWAGHGLRLTENSQVVEGFSSPLWTILTGLAGPLGLDPLSFAWWLGVVLGGLGVCLHGLWGAASEGRPPRLVEGFAAFVPLGIASFPFWVSSGMETGLEVCMLGLVALLVLKEERAGAGVWSGVALGLMTLTRPEGALFVVLTLLWWIARQHQGSSVRTSRYQVLRVGAIAALLAGAYLLVRWVYFGSLLPNTWYAKHNWDFQRWTYLGGFATEYWGVLSASGLSAMLGLTRPETRSRTVLALLHVCATAVFALVARGDWMREYRFLVPGAPALGVLVGAGLSAGTSWVRTGTSTARRVIAVSALAATTALLGSTVLSQARRFPHLKASPEFPARFVMQNAQRLKNSLDAFGARRPLLGLPDIGGLALVFRQGEILDVAGLADFALARATSYRVMDDYLTTEGAPQVIDAHGPSGHIALPNLKKSYGAWAGGIAFLSGLSTENDPRCPGGKSAVVKLPQEELEHRLLDAVRSDPLLAMALWRCAFAYRHSEALPSLDWSEGAARLANSMAETAPSKEEALRWFSAAAVLSRGDAHRRRRAEALRNELFGSLPR